MPQHDYAIANAAGATVRADINNALLAIQSNNASTVAPTATAAFMWYADSSTTAMKVRNSADNAWINVFKMTASTIIPYIQNAAGAAVLGSALVQRTEVNSFTKGQRGAIASVSYASSVAINMDNGNNVNISALTGNIVLANPTNNVPGQGGSIWFTQDGTGSRTISFGSSWKIAGGSAASLSTASGVVDRLDYKVKTSTHIDYVLSQNMS